MKDRKTTIAGIITLVMSILEIILSVMEGINPTPGSIAMLSTGAGLIAAGDSKKTTIDLSSRKE